MVNNAQQSAVIMVLTEIPWDCERLRVILHGFPGITSFAVSQKCQLSVCIGAAVCITAGPFVTNEVVS